MCKFYCSCSAAEGNLNFQCGVQLQPPQSLTVAPLMSHSCLKLDQVCWVMAWLLSTQGSGRKMRGTGQEGLSLSPYCSSSSRVIPLEVDVGKLATSHRWVLEIWSAATQAPSSPVRMASSFATRYCALSRLKHIGGLNFKTFLPGPSVLSKMWFSFSL